MNSSEGPTDSRFSFSILIMVIMIVAVRAQSQALDARIEGTIADENGSIITNATVIAINVDTGLKRISQSNENGTFQFPILTLGSYTILAESPGFTRFERRGINLSAGQTAAINIILQPGRPGETVTVTSDTAIADNSKIEVGHLVNSRDVNNLPLISRNPYNFMLLQPGVTGRAVKDPFVINLSANGLHRRVGYQVDGGYNNDSNLGGFRLTFVSETFVKEVQLLSNGYSAEFGETAGAIVNIITPAGTNDLAVSVSFLYRPAKLSSKPFSFQPGTPDPNVNGYGVTATIGGPIRKDRWHFYSGYEWVRRNTASPITVAESNQQSLIETGLPASIFLNSRSTRDTLPYFIFRTDAKISEASRVSFRYNRFDAGLKNSGVGGLNTTERSTDTTGYDHAFAAQAVTSISDTFFNEFRFQYAKRIARTVLNPFSPSGVSVSITNVANFGPDPNVGLVNPNESTLQFQDAVTKVFEAHSVKIGGGINFIHDAPISQLSASYIFSSVQSYAAAQDTNRKSYTQYSETFGDSEISYASTFSNFFVQDDWRLTRKLKIAAGLRYEFYKPPAADAASPLSYSRKFRSDGNNLAPRLGMAYLLHDGKYRTLLRAGSGIHYDPPLLTMYRRAILNNGNPRYFSFSFQPGTTGSPEFPNRLGIFPLGMVTRDADAVAPDFKTMFAVQSNVQVEQAIAENLSFTAGYLYSTAKHIPVYRNINCMPVGGTLADGRPIYGTYSINPLGNVTFNGCTNVIVPGFRKIMMAESVGNLIYRAIFVQINERFSRGIQLTANYTHSRSRDDAPEENGPASVTQSDPSNRSVDRGRSPSDDTAVFSMSLVTRPVFRVANRFLDALLNNNQLGMIVIADSGEDFNITTADLNRDGVFGPDRPVGVSRNAGRVPAYSSVDARYSRFVRLNENLSLEIYGEATNLFNRKQVSSYNGTSLSGSNILTSLVNPLTGELRGPLPTFGNDSAIWRESRQVQLGAKIHF